MNNNLKILLLDNNKERLDNSELLIRCCGNYRVCSRLSINQHDYESGSYDIVLIHYGNKEAESIEDIEDWSSKGVMVIFFSGGFSVNKDEHEGVWYVSAAYMESQENICTLLKEVFEK